MSHNEKILTINGALEKYPASIGIMKRYLKANNAIPKRYNLDDRKLSYMVDGNLIALERVTLDAKPSDDVVVADVPVKTGQAWSRGWIGRDYTTEETAANLAEAKALKIAELKVEGLARVNGVAPSIDNWDMLDLVKMLHLSVAPAARQPTTELQLIIDVNQAGKAAGTFVNGLATKALVDSYNVVDDPSWPV